MRKYLLLFISALLTCSCVKQISTDELTLLVKNYCAEKSSAENYLQMLRENPDEAFDYLTIFAGKAFKSVSIYENPAEGRYILGEMRSHKDGAGIILISARIDKENFANCAAAADVAKALRELKLRKNNTIRLLLYEGDTPAAIRNYINSSIEAGELHFLNMRFDNDYRRESNIIYINEPPMIANNLQSTMKPVLSSFNFDHFEVATDPIIGRWPIKNSFYGYDADSSRLQESIATAIMTLILIN